jgi:hypothetical protein
MQSYQPRAKLRIEIVGKGLMEAEIVRHLSPATFTHIVAKLPLQGRINRYNDRFIYIITNISLGVEKGRNEFKRGDIAFLAMNGSLCFFLKDMKLARPMNPLGKISKGIEVFNKINVGDVLIVQLADDTKT